VARWETGRTIPSAADLEDVLALAGIVLRAEDERGEPVPPMDGGVVRDRADRYFPAHADPRGDGWWSPREALRSAGGGDAWRRSRAEGVPRITYDLGIWRDVTRALRGTPPDHPTLDEVVAELRARDSQRRRAS
jgi:hypothetical protein